MQMDDLLPGTDVGVVLPLPLDVPFTARAAASFGLSHVRLRALCQAGVIRRVVRGVYVGAMLPDSLQLRAACLKLVVPEDAVVVDRHAGWLLGAQMVLAPGENLEVRPLSIFRPAGRGRVHNELASSGERSLSRDDIVEIGGLRVTTPLRTAWDLGRVRWPDEAIAALDSMLRLGAFSHEELLEGVDRFRGQRWVTTLRAIAPLADGRSESPGESVLRLRCHENGLHGMTPQIVVRRDGEFIARLDLADEDLRIAVEYDGVEWHGSPAQRLRDRERRSRVAETGWDVEVFGKELVFGRQRLCDPILRGLHLRGVQRARRPA